MPTSEQLQAIEALVARDALDTKEALLENTSTLLLFVFAAPLSHAQSSCGGYDDEGTEFSCVV